MKDSEGWFIEGKIGGERVGSKERGLDQDSSNKENDGYLEYKKPSSQTTCSSLLRGESQEYDLSKVGRNQGSKDPIPTLLHKTTSESSNDTFDRLENIQGKITFTTFITILIKNWME